MTKEQAESLIRPHIEAITKLDYSDVSYLDDFIETAWSVQTSGAHIERTRHVGMSHLPVNYVVVTGKDYGLTITIDGGDVFFSWAAPSGKFAQEKVEAVQALVGSVSR